MPVGDRKEAMNNAGRSKASRKWLPFHQSSERAWNAQWRDAGATAAGRAGAASGRQAEGLMSQQLLCRTSATAPPNIQLGRIAQGRTYAPRQQHLQEMNFLKEMKEASRDGCLSEQDMDRWTEGLLAP